ELFLQRIEGRAENVGVTNPVTHREDTMKMAPISPAAVSPSVQQTQSHNAPASKSFSSFMKASADEPSAGQKITEHVGGFVDRIESDRKAVNRTLQASAGGRDL